MKQSVLMLSTILSFSCGDGGVPAQGGATGDTTGAGTSSSGDVSSEESSGDISQGASADTSNLLDTGATTEGNSSAETGGSACGNGRLEDGEKCDDGRDNGEYGACASDCNGLAAHCGDGVTDLVDGETCDDGNANGTDECNIVCQTPGTLLGEVYEVFPTDLSPQASGIRATYWNGHLTYVLGGSLTTVWEIDTEMVSTIDLREVAAGAYVWPLGGAIALDDGNLLLGGGLSSRTIYAFDDTLTPVWGNLDLPGPGNDGVVGLAPTLGGFMMGARDRNTTFGYEYSSYWAIGGTNTGALQWESIETLDGYDGIYARDFRGLSNDQAVLLITDSAAGESRLRIYDEDGSVITTEVLGGSYRTLCVGDNGFHARRVSGNEVSSFDNSGNQLWSATLEMPTFAVGGIVARSACGVRSNGSSIMGYAESTDDTRQNGQVRLYVAGYDGGDIQWVTQSPLMPGDGFSDLAVFVEEDESRVWVATGSNDGTGQRYHYAIAVAI